jgi:NAD(P)-dependent dehydrogenase (short-subunit alcohol dehydrogenase family)
MAIGVDIISAKRRQYKYQLHFSCSALFQLSFNMTRVYLVTGTSSGFGETFVSQILARGDKVIATAHNVSKISKLKDMGASVLELDVTWPMDRLAKALKEAVAIYGKLDVLINNAGYVHTGVFEEVT